MQHEIIPFDKKYKIHSIEKSFSKIINLYPEENKIFDLLNLCCLNDNNEIVIIYHNANSKFCLYYAQKLSNVFISIIRIFFNKKNIDIQLAYHLLKIAENMDDDYKLFYKILNYINWPSGEKGFNYFKSIEKFSEVLKGLVFKKSVSLNDAFFFNEYFLKDYDDFLNLLSEKLTFSERNNILRNLTEFAKKEQKSLYEIIKLFKKPDNIKKIVDFSYDLRNPCISKYKKYFINKINKLNLPKGVDVYFDDSFEREDYSIKIKFNKYSSLLNKVKQLKNSLEKYSKEDKFIDFFDHTNLFKENEK